MHTAKFQRCLKHWLIFLIALKQSSETPEIQKILLETVLLANSTKYLLCGSVMLIGTFGENSN